MAITGIIAILQVVLWWGSTGGLYYRRNFRRSRGSWYIQYYFVLFLQHENRWWDYTLAQRLTLLRGQWRTPSRGQWRISPATCWEMLKLFLLFTILGSATLTAHNLQRHWKLESSCQMAREIDVNNLKLHNMQPDRLTPASVSFDNHKNNAQTWNSLHI